MSFLKTLAVAAASLLLSVTAVQAQTPPPERKASPEDIAKARGEADRVISRFGVGDLFDNISGEDGIPTARHRLSGLVCKFTEESSYTDLQVFPGLPRGEDVGCNNDLLLMKETLYATRYPDKPTAEQVVGASIEAMKRSIQKLKPFTGASVSATLGDPRFPRVVTARFTGVVDGQKVFTRTSAFTVGDWTYAQRATGSADQAMMVDLMSEIELAVTITALLDHPAGEAPGDGNPPPEPTPAPTIVAPT